METNLPPPLPDQLLGLFLSICSFRRCLGVKKEVGDEYNPQAHLFKSCESGNLHMVKTLIECKMASLGPWKMEGGYDIGETPMSVAQKSSHLKIVEFLKQEEGKVTSRTNSNETDGRRFSPKISLIRDIVLGKNSPKKTRKKAKGKGGSWKRENTGLGLSASRNWSQTNFPVYNNSTGDNAKKLKRKKSAPKRILSTDRLTEEEAEGSQTPPRLPRGAEAEDFENVRVQTETSHDSEELPSAISFVRGMDDTEYSIIASSPGDDKEPTTIPTFLFTILQNLYEASFNHFNLRLEDAQSDIEKTAYINSFKFLQETILCSFPQPFDKDEQDSDSGIPEDIPLSKYANKSLATLLLKPSTFKQEIEVFSQFHPSYDSNQALDNISEVFLQEIFEVFVNLAATAPEDEVLLLLPCLDMQTLVSLVDPDAGLSLLHLVCSMGKLKIGREMLKHGFPVDQKAKDGRLPIHFLLERGIEIIPPGTPQRDIENFVDSLARGLPANYTLPGGPDSEKGKEREDELEDIKAGYSLLHFAVESGMFCLVKSLQMEGAKVSALNGKGMSPLEMAVMYEDEEIAFQMVGFLLEVSEKELIVQLGDSALKIATRLKRKKIYRRVMHFLLLSDEVVYSVPGGLDIDFLDPQSLPSQEKHCLLLRAAPREYVLDLIFDVQIEIKFITPVIACYQYFITDSEFLSEILKRVSLTGGVEGACRVAFVWLNTAPEDFYSTEIVLLLKNLISVVKSKEGGFFWKEVVRRMEILEKEIEERGSAPVAFEMSNLDFYKSGDHKKVKKAAQNIFHPKLLEPVANHFFAWCLEIQKCISASEMATNPMVARTNHSSPNIGAATGLLNDVTMWVGLLVLSHTIAEERAKMIGFFVSLIEESLRKKNYYLALGVCMGLREGCVERLKDTWALVPEDKLTTLEQTKEIFASSKNFASLRAILADLSSPACMYLGVALRDIIYLHDSNPSFVGEDQRLVNVLKFKQIFHTVNKWHIEITKAEFTYSYNKNIALYLSAIRGTAREIGKDYLQAVSLYLEPRKKDEVSTPPFLDPGQDAKIQLLIPHYASSPFATANEKKIASGDSKSRSVLSRKNKK